MKSHSDLQYLSPEEASSMLTEKFDFWMSKEHLIKKMYRRGSLDTWNRLSTEANNARDSFYEIKNFILQNS